jgi:hypothetical protein
MKFQTNIESGLSLQINLMEVFLRKLKHVCMRAHTHTHTPISKQDQLISRRFVDLQQKCLTHIYHSLITHSCFLIGGRIFFSTNLGRKKSQLRCLFVFLFFLCMSLFNISLVKDKDVTWSVCNYWKLIPNYCWKTYNIHMNAYFHYDMLSNLNVIQNSKSHDYYSYTIKRRIKWATTIFLNHTLKSIYKLWFSKSCKKAFFYIVLLCIGTLDRNWWFFNIKKNKN